MHSQSCLFTIFSCKRRLPRTGEIVNRLFAETPRQHGFRERVGRVGNLRSCAHADKECRCTSKQNMTKVAGTKSRGIRYMEMSRRCK
jgi:hypothetical protein